MGVVFAFASAKSNQSSLLEQAAIRYMTPRERIRHRALAAGSVMLSNPAQPEGFKPLKYNIVPEVAFALCLPTCYLSMRFLRPREGREGYWALRDLRARTVVMAVAIFAISVAIVLRYSSGRLDVAALDVWRGAVLTAVPGLVVFSDLRLSSASVVEFRRAVKPRVVKVATALMLLASIWILWQVQLVVGERHNNWAYLRVAIGARDDVPNGLMALLSAGAMAIIIVDVIVFGVRRNGYVRTHRENMINCVSALLAGEWARAVLHFEASSADLDIVGSDPYEIPGHVGMAILYGRYTTAYELVRAVVGRANPADRASDNLARTVNVLTYWFRYFPFTLQQRCDFAMWFRMVNGQGCSMGVFMAATSLWTMRDEDFTNVMMADNNDQVRLLSKIMCREWSRADVHKYMTGRSCVSELVLGSLWDRNWTPAAVRTVSEGRWLRWASRTLNGDGNCGGLCLATIAILCGVIVPLLSIGTDPDLWPFATKCSKLLSESGWRKLASALGGDDTGELQWDAAIAALKRISP